MSGVAAEAVPRREHRFACAIAQGFHARPASLLAEIASSGTSACILIHEATGRRADLRSVLSVVALDVASGDACRIEVSGDDADDVIERLRRVLADLPAGDEATSGGDDGDGAPPPTLAHLGAAFVAGRGVSAGVGEGIAVEVGGIRLSEADTVPRGDPVAERARLAVALGDARRELRSGTAQGLAAEVLRAHLAIASDPAFVELMEREIDEGAAAPMAVDLASARFAERLRGAASAYVRDRAGDVQDVAARVLSRLGVAKGAAMVLRGPSVIVAELLTPGQLLALDRSMIRGLVLGATGATSHTVLLARSFAIPAIVGVARPAAAVPAGTSVIVDGDAGIAVTPITPAVRRHYERHARTLARRAERLRRAGAAPGATRDGRRVIVAANISTGAEAGPAVALGAEGIGLFRTEMLFLGRAAAPTEDEQFDEYLKAGAAAGEAGAIIRTFDIGGDKPAAYLGLGAEENPFLGKRGMRLYPRFENLLATQLRAVLRAAGTVGGRGRIGVMAPMASTAAEVAWFRGRVESAAASLRAEGASCGDVDVGVMVEVPSLAFSIDEVCPHVDFLSVGTNDLAQYWFAADRGNAEVAAIGSVREPSFLRLLSAIVDGARRHGKPVHVCGDMARDVANLLLLVGLGFDEVSVPAPDVAPAKSAVARLSAERAGRLAAEAMRARDAAAVDALLAGLAAEGDELFDEGTVLLDSDASTKEEAIKELVDLMHVTGRTNRPLRLERAVWAREATYSTGLGHGFAVPHCKSDAAAMPTLAVVRLRTPVDWGSADGAPVCVAILLAMRESGEAGLHMRVFARLARRLVDEGFRNRMMAATDGAAVVAMLRQELGTGEPGSARAGA